MNQGPKKEWAAPTLRRRPITLAVIQACSAEDADDVADRQPKRAARG